MNVLKSIGVLGFLLFSSASHAMPVGLSCSFFAHSLQINFRDAEILPSTVSNCQNMLYPKGSDQTGIRYRLEICNQSASGIMEERDDLGNWNSVKHFSSDHECKLQDDSPNPPEGQIGHGCDPRYHC